MAIQDIGMFLPAESNYKTPGAYDEALRAEALKRAQYLSLMDQFYEQLDESQRQFNETLKYKVETRDLGLEEQKREFTEDISLRTKIFEADTEYKQESLDIERMKVNKLGGMNYLGTSPAEKSTLSAMDMLKQLTGSKSSSYIPGTSYAPGISAPYEKPTSGMVSINTYTEQEKDDMTWL